MGFLNQSIAQIRDLFASMTPAARITAALLLGVIGVSLGYLFQGYAGGSKEFLFNGEMLAAARGRRASRRRSPRRGSTDYERQGNRILVPRGQKAAYLAAIADAGALPANFDTLLLDESTELGLFTDSKTRDARMKAARERQLSMIVRMMDGVEDAKVLYDIREPKGFERQADDRHRQRAARARARRSRRTRTKMIREAVASAIAGLDPKDVAILNLSRRLAVRRRRRDRRRRVRRRRTSRRKLTYEADDEGARSRTCCAHIPGVRVQVTAELDDTLGRRDPRRSSPRATRRPIREETDTVGTRTTQVEDRGRPGPDGARPQRHAARRGGRQERTVAPNEHRATTDNLVPTTEEVRTTQPASRPSTCGRRSPSPATSWCSVWRERNPERADGPAADGSRPRTDRRASTKTASRAS